MVEAKVKAKATKFCPRCVLEVEASPRGPIPGHSSVVAQHQSLQSLLLSQANLRSRSSGPSETAKQRKTEERWRLIW